MYNKNNRNIELGVDMGNFDFLQEDCPALAKLAQSAESYIYTDPNSCLIKLGLLTENIVNYIVGASGIIMPNNSTHSDINSNNLLSM